MPARRAARPAHARRDTPTAPTCSDCGQRVLMLLNNRTGKWAPISQYPEPGGNLAVSLAARAYRVVPPEDLASTDVTLVLGLEAQPNLSVHHRGICPVEARRRAATPQQGVLPLDGEVTAAVRRPGRPRCTECDETLSLADLAASKTCHDSCQPPREET